jgi:hypothetical protein
LSKNFTAPNQPYGKNTGRAVHVRNLFYLSQRKTKDGSPNGKSISLFQHMINRKISLPSISAEVSEKFRLKYSTSTTGGSLFVTGETVEKGPKSKFDVP